MKSFPKPTRERDEEYSEFIESLPCLLDSPTCNYGEDGKTIGHHAQAKGHGGKSTKCSDRRRIPMCFGHHAEIHRGRETFAKKYGIDIEQTIVMYNSLKERIDAVSGSDVLQ